MHRRAPSCWRLSVLPRSCGGCSRTGRLSGLCGFEGRASWIRRATTELSWSEAQRPRACGSYAGIAIDDMLPILRGRRKHDGEFQRGHEQPSPGEIGMTKIQIELPDATAKAAREAGLLTPRALERLLSEALRRRRAADSLVRIADRVAKAGIAPMSMREINAEVKAARAGRQRRPRRS